MLPSDLLAENTKQLGA